jgi:hypothetical protein
MRQYVTDLQDKEKWQCPVANLRVGERDDDKLPGSVWIHHDVHGQGSTQNSSR